MFIKIERGQDMTLIYGKENVTVQLKSKEE